MMRETGIERTVRVDCVCGSFLSELDVLELHSSAKTIGAPSFMLVVVHTALHTIFGREHELLNKLVR